MKTMSRVANKFSDIKIGQFVAWSGSVEDDIVAGVVTYIGDAYFCVEGSGSWEAYASEIEDGEWTIFKEAPVKPLVLNDTARKLFDVLVNMLASEDGNRDCSALYTRGDWEIAVGAFVHAVEEQAVAR
jgi:hypothetical protein